MIGGDLSGIQDFIYNLRYEGALKSLRGRSLYLQLISEAVASKILEQFDLTRVNLIYCGGGHFYILVPATSDFSERVNAIAITVDEILLNAHRGSITNWRKTNGATLRDSFFRSGQAGPWSNWCCR